MNQKQKNVQISVELFSYLIRYFLLDDDLCLDRIKSELQKKWDRICAHELYEKAHCAGLEKERESARKQYLDMRGVPEDFRW